MSTTANRVMDDYSSLDETEQAEFDRRYKDLMKFRRQLNQLVKDHVRSKRERQRE